MKVLLFAIFALAGAQVCTAAPTTPVQKCPTIAIVAKEATASPGGTVTLTVKITNPESDINYTYNWSLTSGGLTSGQGTSQVTVELESEPTTVTVDLGGGSPTCMNAASITITPKGKPSSGSISAMCQFFRSTSNRPTRFSFA